MAWYRRYRPQRVAELALPSIREQLQRVLETGQYAHAYLFAGTKGTGKTSSARILARILNDPKNEKHVLAGKGPLAEPADDAEGLLHQIAEGRSSVVIEQDAASHRGIDDIRQLQEVLAVVPSEGLVRVVILDEVHMLTTEAFNALLKVLEEPPSRVVFVLATTELHKVPATIQSRCQIVTFRPATTEEVQGVLTKVAAGEGFKLSDEHAQRVAKAAKGSFRDAVKLLEQIASKGSLSDEMIELVLGSQSGTEQLLRALGQKDVTAVSAFFQEMKAVGRPFSVVEQELLSVIQERLQRAIERKEAPDVLRRLADLLTHLLNTLGGWEPIEGVRLELACITWCLPKGVAVEPAPETPTQAKPKAQPAVPAIATPDPAVTQPLSKKVEKMIEEKRAEVAQEKEPEVPAHEEMKSDVSLTFDQVQSAWTKILLTARSKSQALEALLRQTELGEVQGATIELLVKLRFHGEQLSSTKYLPMLRDALAQALSVSQVNVTWRWVEPTVESVEVVNKVSSDDQLMQAVEAAVMALG